MRRDEAAALVGKRVSAWTSANGIYVGTLEALTTHRPWRGVVRITGYVSPASIRDYGRGIRPGHRIGEAIEVGGTNVEPTDSPGETDYAALLDAEAARYERYHAEFAALSPDAPGYAVVARNQGWMGEAARTVRAFAVEVRRESLPLAERIDVSRGDGCVWMRFPGIDYAVNAAIKGVPGSGYRFRDADKAWGIVEDPVVLRAAAEALAPHGAIGALLSDRLAALASDLADGQAKAAAVAPGMGSPAGGW